MSLEIDVLRAFLRLARCRTSPTLARLVERVPGDEADVRRALFSLARQGLIQRTPAGLRLSLAGLAVAVAFAERAPSRKNKDKKKAEVAERVAPHAVTPLVGTRPRRRAA
jgi:DNA-binding IclR family transcriptional regulator